MAPIYSATLAAASLSMAGCLAGLFYTGDGRFKDNVLALTAPRYTVDLGPVDLAKRSTYRYKLTGLPRADYYVAIDVEEDKENDDVRPDYPAIIRLELLTASGETVISELSSLRSWTRSYGRGGHVSILYVRRSAHDISRTGTNFVSELIPYELKLEVVDGTLRRPARLILRGYRL